MKIGVTFGNPETTSGGNALKFYASVRLDVRRIAAIKEGERIGQGRENARKLLLENPDVRGRLADAVYAAKGIKREVPAKRAASRERLSDFPEPGGPVVIC